MTNQITQMRSYMDDSAKTSTFSLQELKSNGMMFTSYFDTKDKAKSYARKYCDNDSAIYIYKTYCIKIYDPVIESDVDVDVDVDVDYSPEYDFTNMTVMKYGSGYMLNPPEDSDYFGNKYFHDGWWINSQDGWFFKNDHYQWLIDNGAVISVDEAEEEAEEEADEEADEEAKEVDDTVG